MLASQKSKFSLPNNVTYLNCAYMSPLLKQVEKAGIEGILRKRNPSKVSIDDFFQSGEILRKEFAKLISASDPKRIVIIPSVSYGLANVVRNVKFSKDNSIILAAEQFPSNYYPWHSLSVETGASLKIIQPTDDKINRGKKWNERILDAIDSSTRVVALGHVHWADGTLFDLLAIRKRTREVNALLIIDGTQSVGALPFSVKAIQPDALICGGYKWLMGPYSIGMAYYGEYFNEGKPIEENWINRLHSEDFAGLVSYQEKYQPGALRYEVGEHSNFILAPMMVKALQQINEWKPQNIQLYCKKISTKAIKQLKANDFWIEEDSFRSQHLFGIRLPKGLDIKTAKKKISAESISVSYRGDAIRVSPNVYNSERDLLKLASALIT